MGGDFMLPHELFAGIPNAQKHRVAYELIAAKYCALVEVAVELNGGEPVKVSSARVKEILSGDPLKDPDVAGTIVESSAGDGDGLLVRCATSEEKQAASQRYRLHRMGGSRN